MAYQAYETVKAPAQAEFTEKRSRFIGYITPVRTREEAEAFISEIRAKHWDATHNVYAYILREGNAMRYSDDGEPQGTAGIPVLDVLQKEGVTDVCVVATRYFGGILLGGGGLVRAYSHTSKIALDAAVRLEMIPCRDVSLQMDYTFYGKVQNLIEKHGLYTMDSVFEEKVILSLTAPPDRIPAFAKDLQEISGGTLSPVLGEERYLPVEK